MTSPTGFKRFILDLDRKYIIIPKILYVTLNLAIYSCYTFRAKFFTDALKIPIKNYGKVSAVFALVIFATSFFWGSLSDKLGRPKGILLLTAFFSACSFQLLRIPIDGDMDTKLAYVTVVSSLYTFFVTALGPMLDKIVLDMLSRHPLASKELYGRQRLCGTIAYGVITALTGLLIDKCGDEKKKEKNYDVIFVSVGLTTAIFLAFAYVFIPSDSPVVMSSIPENNSQAQMIPLDAVNCDQTPLKKPKNNRFSLLINPEFLFFLLVIFANGFSRAIMTLFLTYYMEEEMWMSKTQVATAANFGIVLEIVIFFFSKTLLQKWGIYWMLIGAQLSMVIRFWAYTFLPDEEEFAYVTWVIELLKGINFGLMHSAGVQLATRIATKEQQAMAQGVYSGVFTGLAVCIAGAVGDKLNELYGVQDTFFITSIVSTIALGLFFMKYGLLDRRLNLETCRSAKNTPSVAPTVVESKKPQIAPILEDPVPTRIQFSPAETDFFLEEERNKRKEEDEDEEIDSAEEKESV